MNDIRYDDSDFLLSTFFADGSFVAHDQADCTTIDLDVLNTPLKRTAFVAGILYGTYWSHS